MIEKPSILAIIVLCTFLIAEKVDASVGFGKCPSDKNVLKQFDIARYAGRWYEISSFGAYFEFNGKCIQAVYTKDPQSDGIQVLNAMVDRLTLNIRHIRGSAVPEDKTGDAKLSVTFPMTFVNRTGPYWVLDTDYENYSLVYACRDLAIVHYELGWILSRRPVLEEEYITKVNDVMAANKLRPSQFSPTIQDCGAIDCANNGTCYITGTGTDMTP